MLRRKENIKSVKEEKLTTFSLFFFPSNRPIIDSCCGYHRQKNKQTKKHSHRPYLQKTNYKQLKLTQLHLEGTDTFLQCIWKLMNNTQLHPILYGSDCNPKQGIILQSTSCFRKMRAGQYLSSLLASLYTIYVKWY